METPLMGWVDWVNRYFLDAIVKRRVRAHPSNTTLLPMSPAQIDQLVRLDLVSHDGFIGETWMLWGMLADGTPTAISETDPGWHAMCAALDQSRRLSASLHQAELQLLADPHRKPLRLISDATHALAAPKSPNT